MTVHGKVFLHIVTLIRYPNNHKLLAAELHKEHEIGF